MHITTSLFLYNKPNRSFLADASDLGNGPLFHRIYPDACDVGITLISHQTGKEVTYYLEKEGRNRDNEVTHWILKPTPESIRKVPACRHTYVTIFND